LGLERLEGQSVQSVRQGLYVEWNRKSQMQNNMI